MNALHREPIVVVLCLAAVFAGLSGCGGEKSAAPTADATAAAGADADPPAKVYTNDDLKRLPPPTALPPDDGSPGVVVAAPPPLKAQSPSRAPERPKTAAVQAPARVDVAEQRVAAASARVVELEKRLLAIHNPYLPRPELPPEEALAWKGLDGRQRAARVEQQLVEARGELDAAEADLARLRG